MIPTSENLRASCPQAERTEVFTKKEAAPSPIGFAKVQLLPWCRQPESNRHSIATGGF